MPYSTNHLGITFELHSAGEEGPVNILINPSFQTMGFEPTIIGSVYLNGRQMVDMEVHDGYDIEKLIKLRETLEIETAIPSTVYTFADLRIRRLQSELNSAREAMVLALQALNQNNNKEAISELENAITKIDGEK